MPSPPWAENQYKVVVEFKRSNESGRAIKLAHSPAVLPPQLYGRVAPEVWGSFMNDVQMLAATHPYVVRPSAGRVGSWLGGAVMGAVVGFCMINPDGGDYGEWLPQLQQVIHRHQPAFAAGGCSLDMRDVHGNFWIQLDIDPTRMAVGMPAPYQSGAMPEAGKPGVEYSPENKPGSSMAGQFPGGYPPAPAGYPPAPGGYPPAGQSGYQPPAYTPQ
jgi:hypothetical protein